MEFGIRHVLPITSSICMQSFKNQKQGRRHENNKTALTPAVELFYQFNQTTFLLVQTLDIKDYTARPSIIVSTKGKTLQRYTTHTQ